MTFPRTLKPTSLSSRGMLQQAPSGRFERAAALILAAGLFCAATSYADNPPVPSKHQMMKECMAKQKASEAGRSREDMRNSCKDVTKTEKQNADKASSTPQPQESTAP
jgi:hypothetical protein